MDPKEIKAQEEANKVISEKLDEAYKLIKECEAIADEHQCYFRFDLVYGAGASYTPKPKNEDGTAWESSSNPGCSYDDDYGWQASSCIC